MKNKFTHHTFLGLLVFLFGFQSLASAKQLTEAEYAKIFNIEKSKAKYDLGPQCAFKTAAEARQAEQQVNDPDYNLTYDEFMKKVIANGLLDLKLFHNPNNKEVGHESAAVQGILAWVNYYETHNLAGTKEKCFLSLKEIFSIFYYTGEGYRVMNNAIRQQDTQMINKLRVIGINLGIGAQKLKPYDGYVKRIRGLDSTNLQALKEFNGQHTVGHVTEFGSYTSTTIGDTTFKGNVEYIIRTHKNCYHIAEFSLVEQKVPGGYSQIEEEEVLCLPRTQFKTLYHQQDGDSHQILMEEVVD